MKTREYVKKYKLNEDDNFDHAKFIADFTIDFQVMLSNANIGKDYGRFRRLVNDVKKKWSNINNKTAGQLPEKLWGYFYGSTIMSCKDELFPHLARKKEDVIS
jgi:hypothetical protein